MDGALQRVDTLSGILDLRVKESLGKVDAALTRVDGVISIAADLRDSLKPTLENTASITAHANEASAILFRRDALPAQLLGLTGAAKVTLGETAQTMRTVRDAAPKVADSFVGIGRNADGITADVHTVTSDFVKPKTFWQRVKGWFNIGATAAAHLL